MCAYLPHGSYGTDGAVGVGLSAVIVMVQYGVLGHAFFFDKLRAALAYFLALAIIAPLVLMGRVRAWRCRRSRRCW